MINSMTGFGRGEAAAKGLRVACDIKSVNHRFLEINVRLPKEYAPLEPAVREAVAGKLSRGRVDCFVVVDSPPSETMEVLVDSKIATQYLQAFKKIQERTKVVGEATLGMIVSQPGVVNLVERPADLGRVGALVSKAASRALRGLLTMRRNEGRVIAQDLKKRAAQVRQKTTQLEMAANEVHDALKEKVEQKLTELVGAADLDPARMTQEIALLAMKLDVSEELTRLRGHVDEIDRLVRKGGVVGRRLDFLLQEANREITTCGNKIQGLAVSPLVVFIKTELERIREQVQNVE